MKSQASTARRTTDTFVYVLLLTATLGPCKI